MKKKLAAFAIGTACALTCALAFVGCGKTNDPYYNKTYTLTGTATIDWTSKKWYDSYAGEEKNVSQQEILERHWNEIDWKRTVESTGGDASLMPAYASPAEFIEECKTFETERYKDFAGFKISFAEQGKMEMTITFPTNARTDYGLSDYGLDALTMTYAETAKQYQAINPHESLNFGTYVNHGYHAVGIYKLNEERFLMINFMVEQYVEKIHFEIKDYRIEPNDGNSYVVGNTIITTMNSAVTLYDSTGKGILPVDYAINFTVTDN